VPVGHYLYIEASSPRRPGDTARVLTKTYPATSGNCVQFYYSMYGLDMGTLNLKTYVNGQLSTVFTQAGNQGNRWILAQVTVSSSTPFQVGKLPTQTLKILHALCLFVASCFVCILVYDIYPRFGSTPVTIISIVVFDVNLFLLFKV